MYACTDGSGAEEDLMSSFSDMADLKLRGSIELQGPNNPPSSTTLSSRSADPTASFLILSIYTRELP